MELLIKTLENVKIGVQGGYQDFDDSLDSVLDQFNKIEIHDSQLEWESLKENLSKLKYIDNLIKKVNYKLEGKFLKSVEKFMETIDKNSIYYLRSIDWTNYEYSGYIQDNAPVVREYLENAIKTDNMLYRIDYTIYALSVLINIIENITTLEYNDVIEDQSFISEFSFKKRKTE